MIIIILLHHNHGEVVLLLYFQDYLGIQQTFQRFRLDAEANLVHLFFQQVVMMR